jgi:hypothetical protein
VANLIDLLARSKRPDAAHTVLDEARGHGLDDPVLDFLGGKLALLRGDTGSARAALTRALEGTLPEAMANEARAILRRLGS